MENKKYKIGYTAGVYDMFHIGHLNVIQRAKAQCDYLIVGVTTDALCFKRKNKYPIIKEEDRMAIVEAIKYVDNIPINNIVSYIEWFVWAVIVSLIILITCLVIGYTLFKKDMAGLIKLFLNFFRSRTKNKREV